VQLVAFVEDHASVVDWPALIVAGVAVRLTVGAEGPSVTVIPPVTAMVTD
jgi:hypothetical protein